MKKLIRQLYFLLLYTYAKMVYFIENIKRSKIANYLFAVGAVSMKQCTVFTEG